MVLNDDLADKSDLELVNLTLLDQENFLYLMNRYEKKLLRFIQRISGLNHDDAQDLLQEVFIKVYQNLNDFDKSLKFSSWLYRITRNQVISNYRKNKSRPQTSLFDFDLESCEQLVSDFDINQNLDQALLREKMAKILAKLDSKYREVVILKYLEDRSYEEISDIIKKPVSTVGTLLRRGKIELQKEFRQ
ncbi:MAG: RNA polymerase sigma factor [Patescibacteria group bacterium]|jgi:RNA polymerase sigma-70 factor (ECF subfamily)